MSGDLNIDKFSRVLYIIYIHTHIKYILYIAFILCITYELYSLSLYIYIYTHWCVGFPGGSDGKEFAYNVEDMGLIPGLRRSPGEGNGYPLQYSCLENSMDSRAWQATVQGIAKSWTHLSDFHFHLCVYINIYVWFLLLHFSSFCLHSMTLCITISQKLMPHQAEVHFIYHIRCMVSMGPSKKCCLKYLQTANLCWSLFASYHYCD